MKLNEQGRYGGPESDVFHKCDICGRPIDKNLTRCMRCSGSRTLGRAAPIEQRQTSPLWWLLLLVLLSIGLYGVASRLTQRQVATVDGDVEAGVTDVSSVASASRHDQSPVAAPSLAPYPRRVAQPRSADQSVTTTIPPQPVARPDKPAKLTTVKIICPACEGRGRIAHDAPRSGKYTCPVCAGRGHRNHRYLTAHWQLCKVCDGMGGLPEKDKLFRTQNLIIKKTCPTCSGRGLVPRE